MKKGIIHQKYSNKETLEGVDCFRFGAGILGPPVMTARCYLIDGILIDTGIGLLRKEAVSLLEPYSISKILLTHHHEDHSGNAAALNRLTGAPVLGHAYAIQKMRQKNRIMLYQHLMWGTSEPVGIEPLPEIIESENLCLTPVHTPGHSKDHTVYIEKNRGWVFSGDLFLGTKIKYFRKDERFLDQIDSLKRLLTFDFDFLFCAHNPQMGGGKKAISEKLDYLENLYGLIADLNREGLSETEIVSRLDTRQDLFIRRFTMQNVSYPNMIRSALKTLEG